MGKLDINKLFEKIPYDRLIPIQPNYRWGAVAGVFVLILGLYWFGVHSGKRDELSALETKLTDVKKENQKNKAIADRLDELKLEIAEFDSLIEQDRRMLPRSQEVPELLQKVSDTGTQSGLELGAIRPSSESLKDFYAVMDYTLDMSGEFHNILKFYDEISRLDRIVTISNVTLKEPRVRDGKVVLSASCLATTYRYLEESERPKKEEKPAAPPPAPKPQKHGGH